MIRAAFFDIDGTLLSHKTNSVPGSAVRALHKLREKGVLIFIATGRNYFELPKIAPIAALPFDGVVSLNGQMYMNFHNDHVAQVQAAIHSELPALGDLRRGLTEPVYQVMLYMNAEAQKTLPPMPHVKLTSWHLDGADMIPATGGKAAGIAKVLEYYGIDKSETIAFGDGENDVDMFGAVGTAVAMGNAVKAAKKAADYITDKVLDDGIWNALVHFGII